VYLSDTFKERKRWYVKNNATVKTRLGVNMILFQINFYIGVLLGGAAATIYWKVLPGLKKTEKK